MNALDQLRQQHRHVERLFAVLERGEGDLCRSSTSWRRTSLRTWRSIVGAAKPKRARTG